MAMHLKMTTIKTLLWVVQAQIYTIPFSKCTVNPSQVQGIWLIAVETKRKTNSNSRNVYFSRKEKENKEPSKLDSRHSMHEICRIKRYSRYANMVSIGGHRHKGSSLPTGLGKMMI